MVTAHAQPASPACQPSSGCHRAQLGARGALRSRLIPRGPVGGAAQSGVGRGNRWHTGSTPTLAIECLASSTSGFFAQSQQDPIDDCFVTRAPAHLCTATEPPPISNTTLITITTHPSISTLLPLAGRLKSLPSIHQFRSRLPCDDLSNHRCYQHLSFPSSRPQHPDHGKAARHRRAKMFSPALHEGGPAKGTRSSRRRQRPLSSDSSAQQPKAKRQRVPLSETTFVNPDAPPEMFDVKSDKIDLLGIKRDGVETISAPRKELSVRSKKPKPGERTSKGDGSVVLVCCCLPCFHATLASSR